MNFAKSLGIGIVLALLTLLVIFIVTFLTNGSLSIPAFVVVESTTNEVGAPETNMFFNPLGPIGLALVAGTLIWLASKGSKRAGRKQ